MIARSNLESPGRMVAFLDAVVAIAITVLILPLTDVELSDLGPDPADKLLNRYGFLMMGFAISWFVIINFWIMHHRLFGMVKQVDTPLLRFNVLWLFGIAVLPFPASLLGQTAKDETTARVIASLYSGTLLFISVAAMLMWRHVGRHPELRNERGLQRPHEFNALRGYFVIAVLAIVLVSAQWMQEKALWLLFLLSLQAPLAYVAKRLAPADSARAATKGPPDGTPASGSPGSDEPRRP